MSSQVSVDVAVEPIREFVGDRAAQPQPMGYRVKKVTYGSGPKSLEQYEANIPERQITWVGQTEEEAVGLMLRGYGELCRSGALDPSNPGRIGVPPLQHVMGLLNEALASSIEQRRQCIEDANERLSAPDGDGSRVVDKNDVELPASQRMVRLNEIISGLATSIAALARVKEL